MDFELLLRIAAVLVGVVILSTSFVDYNYLIAKLLLGKQKKKEETVDHSVHDEFLQIIDLWYKLRSKCVDYKLDAAISKLDEVFPLLNDNIEANNNG